MLPGCSREDKMYWPQRQHRRHYDRQRTSFHQESLKSSFLLYSRYLVCNRNHPSSKKKLINVKYKQSDPHVTALVKFIFFYRNLTSIKTSYFFFWGGGLEWNNSSNIGMLSPIRQYRRSKFFPRDCIGSISSSFIKLHRRLHINITCKHLSLLVCPIYM